MERFEVAGINTGKAHVLRCVVFIFVKSVDYLRSRYPLAENINLELPLGDIRPKGLLFKQYYLASDAVTLIPYGCTTLRIAAFPVRPIADIDYCDFCAISEVPLGRQMGRTHREFSFYSSLVTMAAI